MRNIDIIILIVLLIIAGFAHGVNMFQFPYYEEDEGTYMSQAYSFITQGELSPYTYWYDHPPFGWMLLGVWSMITGGFFTFGSAIDSGRAFMLVLHLISTASMYLIMMRLTRSRFAAICAALFFSLSPLAIFYHRRVLLDNIIVALVLLSIALLLHHRDRLSMITLSGMFFGLALLTKLSAVLFMPVALLILLTEFTRKQKWVNMGVWLLVVMLITSLFPLYALLKGEFFPSEDRVSLLGALLFHAGRDGGYFLDQGSDFMMSFLNWYEIDAVLFILGLIGIGCMLIVGLWRKGAMILGVGGLIQVLFLVRGGIVLEYYVILLIPFLAMAGAYMVFMLQRILESIVADISRSRLIGRLSMIIPIMLVAILLGGMVENSSFVRQEWNLYTADQTYSQVEIVRVLPDVAGGELVLINNYAFVDLVGRYEQMEWYSKAEFDASVHNRTMQVETDGMVYFITTHQAGTVPQLYAVSRLERAYRYSFPVYEVTKDGWTTQIRETRYPLLVRERTWDAIRDAPRQTVGVTQSELLLVSVIMDDEEAFYRILQDTFAFILPDGTMSSRLDGGRDTSSDSAATQNVALALLLAGERFDNELLIRRGVSMLGDMWRSEVAQGVMSAGNWGRSEFEVTIHTENLKPAHYRVFSRYDSRYERLIASSYDLLARCAPDGLPVRTCYLAPDGGVFFSQRDRDYPSGIALNVGFDALIADEQRAYALLNTFAPIRDATIDEQIPSRFFGDGRVLDSQSSISSSSQHLAVFMDDQVMLERMYFGFFMQRYSDVGFEGGKNIDTQLKAILALHIFDDAVPFE